MPLSSADTPTPIRARIHNGALHRVTKLFSSTALDIFNELLQNARRAGANRVCVETEALTDDATGPIKVTVSDDGTGVADPAVLISFGETAWDEATAHNEDAAGMGLASLARRGCCVFSRQSVSPTSCWRVTLTPTHFLGEEDAIVHPDDGAPYPHGTAVSFEANETLTGIDAAICKAAQHYPLPVTFNGDTIERRAFLDGAIHVELWRGAMFGVFNNKLPGFNQADLNFYGLTLPIRLPAICTLNAHNWTVRADIHTCPELELVLPARKEAVETPFLQDMREAARVAIYNAISHADPTPRLAHTDWKGAKDAGIHLQIPPAELQSWEPCTADIDFWSQPPPYTLVANNNFVVTCDPDPHDAQAFHRAATKNALHKKLFAADNRLDGYDWYDALPRLHSIETNIRIGDDTHNLDTLNHQENDRTYPQPDAITLHMQIQHANKSSETITIPADVAFIGDAYSWLHDIQTLVTTDSDLTAHELAGLLHAGFFSPSDDADADSWETQHIRFEEEALHVSLKLLCSDDEARKQTITNAILREVLWLMPKSRDVNINVHDRKITVTIADPAVTSGAAHIRIIDK